MTRPKKLRFFSKAERISIIQEYLESDLRLQDVAKKHKISNGSVISNWMRALKIPGKSVILQLETKKAVEMKKPESNETDALKARILELEKQLNWSKLQNLALNELIKVAESQGMEVRKKAGAKQ